MVRRGRNRRGDGDAPIDDRLTRADFEIGLIDRGDLDERTEIVQERAEAPGEVAVVGEVGAEEGGIGTEATRVRGGHRGANAERARRVGGRGDDAAPVLVTADDHRPSDQLGTPQHLGIGEEGIEIDMEDPSPGHRRPHVHRSPTVVATV